MSLFIFLIVSNRQTKTFVKGVRMASDHTEKKKKRNGKGKTSLRNHLKGGSKGFLIARARNPSTP